MNIYGIKNITDNELNFKYDKYYREVALKLKNLLSDEERNILRKEEQERFSSLNNIEINLEELKNRFIDLITDKNSEKYLWILYSKYQNDENYIDKISNILKKENDVIRGGTNTYKVNGWMAHTLYVYQITNYNIAKNIELVNFDGNEDNKNQLKELHELYEKLSIESKFLLRIFCLIHDIGVIEDIKYHDVLGEKYVEKVLEEIGLTQKELEKNNINIDLKDFVKILQGIIKYHTLITSLSAESNDDYVEDSYKNLIENIPDIESIEKQIPEILFIMAYGDIIAVDESLMDIEKYQRTKEGYVFFKEITENIPHTRNKEKITIDRICDTAGKIKYETLKNELDSILEKNNIDKDDFIEDMYNIRLMRYTGPLMKNVNDVSLTIKIYNELFKLITALDGRNALKEYTIFFVPDKHENEFVKEFKNNNFFKCVEKMKKEQKEFAEFGNTRIEKEVMSVEKKILIRII